MRRLCWCCHAQPPCALLPSTHHLSVLLQPALSAVCGLVAVCHGCWTNPCVHALLCVLCDWQGHAWLGWRV